MIEGIVAVRGTAGPSMAIGRDDADSFEYLPARLGGAFDRWEVSAN